MLDGVKGHRHVGRVVHGKDDAGDEHGDVSVRSKHANVD